MQVVQWPNLLLSFNLALHEVLRPFFNGGGVFVIYGKSTKVHRVKLAYTRETILEPGDRPRVAILGDRPASPSQAMSPGKCESTTGNRVRVSRTAVERVVSVIIPRGDVYPIPPYVAPMQTRPGDVELAWEVWQNLIAIFQGQKDEFRTRGIVEVSLDHFPQEKSDEQYIVFTGRLIATAEYVVPTGFSP